VSKPTQQANHPLTDYDMDNLRHTLGARDRKDRYSWGCRNFFGTGAGSKDDESMQRLLKAGYVTSGSERWGNRYYFATAAGCKALGFTDEQMKRANVA